MKDSGNNLFVKRKCIFLINEKVVIVCCFFNVFVFNDKGYRVLCCIFVILDFLGFGIWKYIYVSMVVCFV